MSGTIDARLRQLGIELPEPAAPVANYVPFAVSGNHLWYCYQSGVGTGSAWTRMSAPSLNLLPTPFRVYDSRPGQPCS